MDQTVPSKSSTAVQQAAAPQAPGDEGPGARHAAVHAANEAVARLAALVRGIRLPRPALPRLRLLPGVIFVAVLMLGVRTTDLMNGMMAETIDPGTPTLAQAADPAPAPGTAVAGSSGGEGEAGPAAAGSAVSEEAPATPPETVAMLPPDLEPRSPTEMDLLQNLSARRAELQEREHALSRREALLTVAEERLAQKTAELETLRVQIEDLLVQVDQQREEQFAGLVGIYENMRPADAAAIFDGLDIEVLINVLDRMREQKSAAILAGMNPERARQVTTELAQRQQLPLALN